MAKDNIEVLNGTVCVYFWTDWVIYTTIWLAIPLVYYIWDTMAFLYVCTYCKLYALTIYLRIHTHIYLCIYDCIYTRCTLDFVCTCYTICMPASNEEAMMWKYLPQVDRNTCINYSAVVRSVRSSVAVTTHALHACNTELLDTSVSIPVL